MLERDLEDAICQDPTILDEHARVLRRQLVVPHGILDLLVWRDHSEGGSLPLAFVQVVELKRGVIRPKDLSQVMRYVFDVESCLWQSQPPCPAGLSDEDAAIEGKVAEMTYRMGFVRGMLIGEMIDTSTLVSCYAANVDVLLWEHDGDGFHLDAPEWDSGTRDAPWAGRIIDLCRDVARRVSVKEETQMGR